MTAVMWHSMRDTPPVSGNLILVSDGTVLAEDSGDFRRWWRLSPNDGDYLTGTWSHGPMMLNHHFRVSPAPLLDGRFLAVGSQGLPVGGPLHWPLHCRTCRDSIPRR